MHHDTNASSLSSEVRQAEEKRQQKNQNDEKFSNVFRKGEVVLYKGQEDVTVLKAHFDDPTEVYYTIKRSDGTERQTISKYLSRKSAAAESPSPPSSSSSALRKAEGVEESSSKDDNDTKGNDSKSAVAATSGNSSSSSSSFPFHAPPKDTNIKYVVVKHGAKAYYIPCDPDKETVGGIKIRLEEVLGVPKRVIRLVAGRLTKADDDTVLASVRIKHKSKMMVLFKEGFHIARYGEEVLQKAIAQIEAAEQLADSTEKRFEHRGLDLAEGVRRLFSLNDAVSNLHRTLEGVTVKSASEKIVSGLKERLRVLKRRVKEITKARSEFG
mmetsp:Transcript_24287/g.39017  ORF Transcript_24287/g.39017 Transcript_24287/m.39017 type:complete len:326 (+) Transcript_24287:359-1336(+)